MRLPRHSRSPQASPEPMNVTMPEKAESMALCSEAVVVLEPWLSLRSLRNDRSIP